MARDYIPASYNGFNDFQRNLVKIVIAKAALWSIPITEVNTLSASSVAYSNSYKTISNKANRTHSQVEAHKQFRKLYEKDFRLFVNSFLRANKNVSVTDMGDMGLKIRGNRRKQRSAIETAPNVLIESVPAAWLQMWCRIESHVGRASIHPESDGLEICFSIGTEPKSNKDCANTFFSKKAHIRLTTEPEWRGKMFYGFIRWKNLSNDALSGPWCMMVRQRVY